ncbi:MAG: tetratricopeptide repeat protein, partial [Alphaproteobacteria bacterium]|nr:tetratricopeptide repeat protein [Alphaproteobacteria bacterium]
FAEAADRLERLAEAMAAEPPQRQAEVLGQAANAWLAAGYAERAARIATLAVRLDPGGVEYYVDRAIAQAQMGRVREARRDLDLALELAPERADILALRASAKRRMGEGPGALADVERALRLMPDQPEALLERGHLRREAGDRLGARADWRRLIRLMPGSPAAEEAARALEALDLWLDRPEPQPTPQRR